METNPSTPRQSFDMEPDHFEPTEGEASPKYAFKIIRLNPGISPLNFTCCLINIVTGVFGFMTVSMLEPFALLDKDYFNIDQGHVGTITSLALSVDLIIKMLFLIPYGHCSDRFGRKVVIYYGAANYFLACVILSSQKTIPGFIFAKIFLANAGAAVSSVPLIADYTADESRGRAAGLMVALVALTSMFGNLFMKLLLYQNIALDKCYIIAGVLVVFILILNTFGLKSGRYHAPSPPDAPKQNTSNEASILQNLKETVQIFRENGWIQIGFILQMAGNSTSAIFFNYMSLYIKSLFSSDIDSNTANIAVNNIQTFTFIPPLICTIAYGHFLNKGNNPIKMSFLVLCGSIAAFLLIISSNDPSDSALVLAAMCTGAFLPGILVLSSFINIKNYPSDKRATMGGFMGLFSNICNFLISSSAGLLYDKWLRKGPFIFEVGLLTVGILLICAIYKRKGLGNYTALKDSKQLDLERLIVK